MWRTENISEFGTQITLEELLGTKNKQQLCYIHKRLYLKEIQDERE